MKYTITLLLSVLAFALFAQEIDSELSRVDFRIPNMMLNTVDGTFRGMQGTVNFDKANISESSFDVCISSETVNTSNAKRDTHLKESDFFDVMYHPEICFKSDLVRARENDFITEGQLTILGISSPATITFTANEDRLVGKVFVNRELYSLGKGTNTFMVGEEAEVTIYCYFKK